MISYIYIPYENVHYSICFHTPLLLRDFIFKKNDSIWKWYKINPVIGQKLMTLRTVLKQNLVSYPR